MAGVGTKKSGRGAASQATVSIRLKVDDAYSVVDPAAVRIWQRAFASLNGECRVHGTDRWGVDDLDADICVILAGQEPYIPKPYNFNVLVSPKPVTDEKRNGVHLVVEAGALSVSRGDVRRWAEGIMEGYRVWAQFATARGPRSPDEWFEKASAPKVSVLIATFNRPAFLRRTLISVVEQRYPNWEIILVNDGGPSVRDIAAAVGDDRIQLIENRENRGKCFCLNQAFRASSGDFSAYLDDDDVWYPDHLQRLLLPLTTLPLEMAYSDAEEVTVAADADGRVIEVARKTELQRQTNLSRLLSVNDIRGISYAHSRRLFEVCGGFDDTLRVLDDWDMVRRLAVHTYPYHVSYTTARFDRRVGVLGQEMPHMTHRAVTQTVRYFQDRKRIVDRGMNGSLTDGQQEILTRIRRLAAADLLAAEGYDLEQKGDPDGATAHYRRALSVLPSHALSARFLGVRLLKTGALKEALRLFETVIETGGAEVSDFLHAMLAAIGDRQLEKAAAFGRSLRASGLALNEASSALLEKYEAATASLGSRK